jgi:streptomycin 6-kinase
LQPKTTDVLLHADLHHENILISKNENGLQYLAIDPQGAIGPAIYEIGAFVRNPIIEISNNKNIKNIIENRILKFSEYLNYAKKELHEVNYAQAVLSTFWSIGQNRYQNYLLITNTLNELRNIQN